MLEHRNPDTGLCLVGELLFGNYQAWTPRALRLKKRLFGPLFLFFGSLGSRSRFSLTFTSLFIFIHFYLPVPSA